MGKICVENGVKANTGRGNLQKQIGSKGKTSNRPVVLGEGRGGRITVWNVSALGRRASGAGRQAKAF